MDWQTLGLRFASQERIRIDLLKAVHSVLLSDLPREGVLEFWARHPLSLFKGPLPPRSFFRFLWEGEAKVPPPYFWNVMEDLETFLEAKGLSADRFFRLLNHGPGGGPPVDPGWLSLPEMGGRDGLGDPREGLLAVLPSVAMRLFPGCRMEAIGAGPGGDGAGPRSRLFLFQPLSEARGTAAPDFRLFPGRLFAALPRLLGCAAFDTVDVRADMRGPAAALGGTIGAAWNWKADRLRYGARAMGRLETLGDAVRDWPEAIALRDALGRYLGCPVLRMERDFASPRGREARLRAGCAYGAPAFLVRIGFSANRRWSRWMSALRKAPALPAPRRAWEMTETLHREMLAALDPESAG